MNSPIRWAGSKRQMLGTLLSMGRDIKGRYIEPFAGSASLFFALEPREAILGDLNSELIQALRQLRDSPTQVIQIMQELKTDPDSYYELRRQDPQTLGGAEAAARFFILNRLCFNGLYRTNRAGRFNVPYGRHKSMIINFDLYFQASKMLSRAALLKADFEQTVERASARDFVFLDPPYITRAGGGFCEYLPNSFCLNDLIRLERSLTRLDNKNVKFALTYLDCPEARELIGKWKPQTWTVRRNIAGFAAHRKTSTELLATNLSKN